MAHKTEGILAEPSSEAARTRAVAEALVEKPVMVLSSWAGIHFSQIWFPSWHQLCKLSRLAKESLVGL